VIQSQAVLIAIGVDWEGRRQVLGVELANRESCSLAVSKAVVAGVWKPPREETAGRLLRDGAAPLGYGDLRGEGFGSGWSCMRDAG
jgi:hypothetical protein